MSKRLERALMTDKSAIYETIIVIIINNIISIYNFFYSGKDCWSVQEMQSDSSS